MLVMSGTLLVLFRNFSGNFVTTDIVIFMVMAIAPLGNFLQKKVFDFVVPEVYGVFRNVLAAIFFLIVSAIFEPFSTEAVFSERGIFFIVVTGVFIFGVSKILWFTAIRHLGVPVAVALTNAAPVFTLIFAILFLKEIPTLGQILALPLVICGMLLLNDIFLSRRKKGIAISGEGRGRKLGFPTINLRVSAKIPSGVFAVSFWFRKKKFRGIGHFGARPTFENNEFSAEIHGFDFSHKVPEGMRISFLIGRKIREIQKFENAEVLVTQIKKDIVAAKKE